MKTLWIAAAAAAATISGAHAQEAGISDPFRMVRNFDSANLGPVLTELGVVWQAKTLSNGRPIITASIGGQFAFNILPAACRGANHTDCVGANYVALYSGVKGNQQRLSAFNQKYVFSSVGAMPENVGVYISRYEIADYGIPRGNVASSIATFVYLAEQFSNEMASGAQTISADGFAEDMSSRYLNRVAASEIGIDASPVEAGIGIVHRDGFEAAPATVRLLMTSGNVPVNKIDNLSARKN